MTAFDPRCRRCPRLARHLDAVKKKHPRYHARPVAPFGDPDPGLLVVGLAPGLHGANATGRPFTGDHAGIILYKTLHEFGFASHPESISRRDGLQLSRCRITNAVKCLPPENKPTGEEVNKCNVFLETEISKLKPGSLVMALGTISHRAVLRACGLRQVDYKFKHGALHPITNGLRLIDSYHCSRYNTQTKRLTTAMFRTVFRKATKLLDRP
ncbi:MAG: uracil-DNA glycosylase [Gammaproteobacteria bacterium]|nr:uracil-DNA glycosylase [Gammaproteobacteria bacterium]